MDEPQWAGQTSPNQELELPTASTRTRSPTQAGQDMKLERDDTNIVVKHSIYIYLYNILLNYVLESTGLRVLWILLVRSCAVCFVFVLSRLPPWRGFFPRIT